MKKKSVELMKMEIYTKGLTGSTKKKLDELMKMVIFTKELIGSMKKKQVERVINNHEQRTNSIVNVAKLINL